MGYFANGIEGAIYQERLVRPVRCYLCNQPMHYAGQPGHVPEVWVEVHGDDSSDFYAHVSCWNRIVAARPNGRSAVA